ncbi:hypothetical protein F7725_002020 [Dissostichus mawsoni]|uniref:Vang-like protein n=1 Tax=Dissostichus mawsoni TaxID=36200 RepID=A0A7J5Y299_DISMA|nr:hypothetical protein F7725_002020 [Dissostichus mawsoni]
MYLHAASLSGTANHNGQALVRELPVSVQNGVPQQQIQPNTDTQTQVNVDTTAALWGSCRSSWIPEARLYSNPFLLLSSAANLPSPPRNKSLLIPLANRQPCTLWKWTLSQPTRATPITPAARGDQTDMGIDRSRERHKASSKDSVRSERSVVINPPDTPSQESPVHNGEPLPGEPTPAEDQGDDAQDDNWGETTTAVTGTSELSISQEEVVGLGKGLHDRTEDFRRYLPLAVGSLVGLLVLATPWPSCFFRLQACGTACEGLFLSLAFKLLILLMAMWALFLKPGRASLPRVCVYRAFLTPSHSCSPLSLVDSQLFVHYLAVVLLELRHLQPCYSVCVIRSTDGETRHYNIGQLSVQKAALTILEYYYRDFLSITQPFSLPQSIGLPNTWLAPGNTAGAQPGNGNQSRAMVTAAAKRKDSAHNELYYEEADYERRVRKRRARLVVAVEEAFTHIRRMKKEDEQATPSDIMDVR